MAAVQVFPTKGNLIASKNSLRQSRLGYELMDRKRNILVREMVVLSDKARELRNSIESNFAEAYTALQRANIMIGVNSPIIGQIPIDSRLETGYRSVMGVELPSLTLEYEESRPIYGILQSNHQFDVAFIKFNKVKYLSVTLAEIENSIYRLATAIKKTQKRANALENILIPQYINQVRFITNALEEKEREEFSRQKVIKSTKMKKIKKVKLNLMQGIEK